MFAAQERTGLAKTQSGESVMRVGRHRSRATGVAAAVLLVLGPPIAGADDPPLEEIEVTGSRINRRDFSSASPIVSVR